MVENMHTLEFHISLIFRWESAISLLLLISVYYEYIHPLFDLQFQTRYSYWTPISFSHYEEHRDSKMKDNPGLLHWMGSYPTI